MTKYYAGIGSRKTPKDVLKRMTDMAILYRSQGYILNSGGAKGADSAFEAGAGDDKRIFLANSNDSDLNWDEAYKLVYKFHPNPTRLSEHGAKLMARNGFQVLGPTLFTPVEFVICWAPGSTYDKEGKLKNVHGGTGQAVRIAYHYGIPIRNLKDEEV